MTMVWLDFVVKLANAIAWPAFWLITVVAILALFRREIRDFLRGVYAVETPWLNLYRTAKEAAPDKDVPPPPASAKQRILDEWQEVHDCLAEIYEEKVGKTPPPRYRPLASRLKSQGHVRGNTAALLDEVRNIQRTVKRQPGSAVSPEQGEYYARIVAVLLELLGNAPASTS